MRVVLLLLQGLTGAEALPRVITMFFFDFLLQPQILWFSWLWRDAAAHWKTGRLFSRFNSEHGLSGIMLKIILILNLDENYDGLSGIGVIAYLIFVIFLHPYI